MGLPIDPGFPIEYAAWVGGMLIPELLTPGLPDALIAFNHEGLRVAEPMPLDQYLLHRGTEVDERIEHPIERLPDAAKTIETYVRRIIAGR